MINLDSIYDLRRDFIIIGLTGRLGSGCSTTAKILSGEFEDAKFPLPQGNQFNNNEERKYKIVYNYKKENWDKFEIIRPSNIITFFLLKSGISPLQEFLNAKYLGKETEIQNIINNIKSKFEELTKHSKDINIETFDSKIDSNDYEKIYSIFFDGKLHKFYGDLKNEFHKLKNNTASSPFQYFGDNIRRIGDPTDSTERFDPKFCYKLSEVINKLIKIIKWKNEKDRKKTRIVIDSIRNSMEALFFKERYSAFYLFAINTENKDRENRLTKDFTKSELKALDNEYDEIKSKEKFYHQDIRSCIENADIYLYNPTDNISGGDTQNTLKKHLIRYLTLILHPGIVTPTSEERCMQIAYTAKYNSGCISRQVGAVVTDEFFSMKSIGWNNTAQGQTPCLLRSVDDLINNSDNFSFSDYEKSSEFKDMIEKTYKDVSKVNLKGRNISFCFKECQNCKEGEKNQVHTRSLHAEENAMLQISKYGGEGLKGGFLFTTASPCELCSKKAFQLGISKIYYLDPYPGIAQEQILRTGKDENRPKLELFVGAIGKAYHQLYAPFMPYKDELKILLEYDYNNALTPEDKAAYKLKLEQKRKEIDDKLNQLSNI